MGPGFKPGAAGWDAQKLTLCYAAHASSVVGSPLLNVSYCQGRHTKIGAMTFVQLVTISCPHGQLEFETKKHKYF